MILNMVTRRSNALSSVLVSPIKCATVNSSILLRSSIYPNHHRNHRMASSRLTGHTPFAIFLLKLVLFGAVSVQAQQASDETQPDASPNGESEQAVEELVTIGTRRTSQTLADSVVPVDLYISEEIESVNSSDLIEVLSTLVPSFSVRRQPISDGASFVRPTHLRNLESHHSLVLVANKRRHRSAFMLVGGYGSQGADIGTIPSIAIDSVEILRDGAAAQYGSDAIAGVINFRLREDDAGVTFRARYGAYKAGDGQELALEGNIGRSLTDAGFLNLSFQLSQSDATSRSQAYDISIAGTGTLPHEAVFNELTVDGVTYYGPDAFTYTYSESGIPLQVLRRPDGIPDDRDRRYADNFLNVGAGRPFSSPEQIWGQPERQQAIFAINTGLDLGDSRELYAFSTYAQKDQTGGFFYRRAGISTFYPVRLADGSIFSARRDLFPAGFTPQFTGEVGDFAVHGGLRERDLAAWDYDLSIGYGRSKVHYELENTLNPSLGPASPTKFQPGNLVNSELAWNFDALREFDTGLQSPLHVALGLEYRNETYQIEEGDPASYQVGPFAFADPFNFEITQEEVDADPYDGLIDIECRIPGFETRGSLCPAGDPIHNTLPIGSNGFPGYSPVWATDYNQFSYAGYLDLEVDLNEKWRANGALRYENFEDFGSVLIWKLASRVSISESTNVRGSLGTGFRAPTAGQLSTINVSTRISAEGIPIAVGLFPASHPGSQLFGSIPLDAEYSSNITLGLTSQLTDSLEVAVDYYNIELEDRIILSSRFQVTPAQTERLLELNVPGATEIGLVSFFTNNVDTRTRGLDLVASWSLTSALGESTFNANMNINDTKITGRGSYVGAEGEFDIENGVPNNRMTLSLNHGYRNVDFLVRVRRYGEYENASNASLAQIQNFQSEVMVDLAATLNFKDGYQLRIGVENVFNNYPDRGEFETCCGRIYRSDSIMPWQGTLYYFQFSTTDQ